MVGLTPRGPGTGRDGSLGFAASNALSEAAVFGTKEFACEPQLVTLYDPVSTGSPFRRHTAARLYGHLVLGGVVLKLRCVLASGEMVLVPATAVQRFPGASANDNRHRG